MKNKYERIKEFYNKQRVSERIMKIKLNEKRYNYNLDNDPDIYDKLDSLYKKYNIKQYIGSEKEIKAQMAEDLKDYDIGLGNITETQYKKYIDNYYKQYDYREKLMISGQYEEFKINNMKSKYLSELKRSGIDINYINYIKKLSTEEFEKLSSIGETDITKNGKYALPMIQDYYQIQGTADISIIEELESRLTNVIEKVLNTTIISSDSTIRDITPIYANNEIIVNKPKYSESDVRNRLKKIDKQFISKLNEPMPKYSPTSIAYVKDRYIEGNISNDTPRDVLYSAIYKQMVIERNPKYKVEYDSYARAFIPKVLTPEEYKDFMSWWGIHNLNKGITPSQRQRLQREHYNVIRNVNYIPASERKHRNRLKSTTAEEWRLYYLEIGEYE